MSSFPRAPAILPREFAAALGHAVAGFGFLEEALKRAIHALSLDGIGPNPGEADLQSWIERMEDLADDSLGTLIDSFLAACTRCGAAPTRVALTEELATLRQRRNLLCHASWKPGNRNGAWRPAFVSTKGEVFMGELTLSDLRDTRARTLRAARKVIGAMRRTGMEGWWVGSGDEPPPTPEPSPPQPPAPPAVPDRPLADPQPRKRKR